jgi:hypothetical protein
MKAERRHELQTNTLALWLRWRAPEVWAKYGTHILLGVIVVLLAIVLARHLMNKPAEEANRAAEALAAARDQIREVSDGMRPAGDARGILTLIQQAMEQSKRPEIQAEAQLAMGDYYWALFNAPEMPGSFTQPTIVPEESSQEMLNKAEENYSAALKQTGGKAYVAARARFGLAAVAEARGYDLLRKSGFKGADASAFWDKAKEQYQAIVDDPATPQVLKDEAKWHLEQLVELRKPVWVAEPPPSTSTSGPSSGPTSLPGGLRGILPEVTRLGPGTRPTTTGAGTTRGTR